MAQDLRKLDNVAIGRRLRALRKYLGIRTQEDMANRIGMSRTAYNANETGENRIDPENAQRMIDLAEGRVDLDWIYSESWGMVRPAVQADLEPILDEINAAAKAKELRSAAARPARGRRGGSA